MMTNKPFALSQSQPLSVNAVTKVYSGKDGKSQTAVNQVSFEIRPGEIFGLLGPNGAGKTTTISMITTLETPTAGTVQVFGIDNQKQPIEAKKLFGVVPQEIVTQGFFNVMEILSFHSGYYGILKNNDRIEYLNW
jgi:ABC-2 type transport system ATP-binding protein